MALTSSTNVLIIGGGLAGLSLALRLADQNRQVTILTKTTLSEGSSLYAQGGIAAVLSEQDSFEQHIADTMIAGAELSRPEAVEYIIRHAPENIQWLIDNGVEFTRTEDDQYHLTREGGHSQRRVIHAKDATGHAIITRLEKIAKHHNNIDIREDMIAVDLITSAKLHLGGPDHCLGLYAYDINQQHVESISANAIILATGGASKTYLYSSNPDTSTGDGIAMAWRAGCRVANMEFVQFHPTCLYHPHAKSSLITEAVRGEGGVLLLPDGNRFMDNHDPRGELASRDIVARAIDYEMKKHGIDSVFLDISHKSEAFILDHFPTIHAHCLNFGIDMTKQPVPVVPAAHYSCGGVVTDLNGRADLDRLYVIGESAFTGLHGANRLASNSLLECLVMAQAAANDLTERSQDNPHPKLPSWDESRVTDPDEQIIVSHNWDELRRLMWDYVGIARTNKRLQRAYRRIHLLQDEIRDYYSNFKINNDLIELRNLVMAAELIVKGAMKRHESRGLHYTLDYPDLHPKGIKYDNYLVPDNYVGRYQTRDW